MSFFLSFIKVCLIIQFLVFLRFKYICEHCSVLIQMRCSYIYLRALFVSLFSF